MWPHPWPRPLILKVKFWKSRNSGMGCPIDMERKEYEPTECWTRAVTFNFELTHDLDLELSTSNFEIVVSWEWEGRSTWNKTDMSQYGVIPTLWHWAMTLILDVQCQILQMLYLRNGRVDWHGTKGIRVDRMLDLYYKFELWSHQWTWHWIFKVNFLNNCISGMGGLMKMERKGIWVDRMLYLLCDLEL